MDYQTALYSPDFTSIPKLFDREDIEAIIKVCRNRKIYLKNDWGLWMQARDEAIIFIMYHCALRPKECTSLRFDDFNIKDMSINIRSENNKERQARTIPVPEIVMPSLKKYLSFPRYRFWGPSRYLFPSFEHKNLPLSSSTWKYRFRRILKKANIWVPPYSGTKPMYSSYTLRHTKATQVLEKTKDIRAVQFMLGHRDPRSTQIYHHLTPSWKNYLREAMN